MKVVGGADTANLIWDEIIDNTEIEEVSNASIDKFLTNYITHRFGKTKKNQEFNVIVQQIEKTKVKTLLDDLKAKSKIYKNIVTGKGYNSKINYELNFLNLYKITQFRPILLSLFSELTPNETTKLENVLLTIKNFISIYIVIGSEKTNKLEKIIYKYSKELNDEYSDELCKKFLEELYKELPVKDDFVSKFGKLTYTNNKKLYPDFSKNYKKEITHVIKEYEIFTNSDDEYNVKEFTLEHVDDDSTGGLSYLIGNIIPLSKKDNKACNRKPIEEKIEIYNRSSYSAPRLLVSTMKKNFANDSKYWNDEYVKNRTTKMANQFYKEIWINKF